MNEQILRRLKTGGESIEEMQYLCTEVAPKEIERLVQLLNDANDQLMLKDKKIDHLSEVIRQNDLQEETFDYWNRC